MTATTSVLAGRDEITEGVGDPLIVARGMREELVEDMARFRALVVVVAASEASWVGDDELREDVEAMKKVFDESSEVETSEDVVEVTESLLAEVEAELGDEEESRTVVEGASLALVEVVVVPVVSLDAAEVVEVASSSSAAVVELVASALVATSLATAEPSTTSPCSFFRSSTTFTPSGVNSNS